MSGSEVFERASSTKRGVWGVQKFPLLASQMDSCNISLHVKSAWNENPSLASCTLEREKFAFSLIVNHNPLETFQPKYILWRVTKPKRNSQTKPMQCNTKPVFKIAIFARHRVGQNSSMIALKTANSGPIRGAKNSFSLHLWVCKKNPA